MDVYSYVHLFQLGRVLPCHLLKNLELCHGLVRLFPHMTNMKFLLVISIPQCTYCLVQGVSLETVYVHSLDPRLSSAREQLLRGVTFESP